MWSRIYLIPLLQAEEDRDQIRRYWADKEREKVLLGTDTKVYHSDRYVQRVRTLPVVSGKLFETFIMVCGRGRSTKLLTGLVNLDLCGLLLQ